MTAIGLPKLLWMVIVINGDVSGVLHDEPMPDYMSFAECEASAAMRERHPSFEGRNVKFKYVWSYGRPLETGRYWKPME